MTRQVSATKIILRSNDVADEVPDHSMLLGELAVNTADDLLYVGMEDGNYATVKIEIKPYIKANFLEFDLWLKKKLSSLIGIPSSLIAYNTNEFSVRLDIIICPQCNHGVRVRTEITKTHNPGSPLVDYIIDNTSLTLFKSEAIGRELNAYANKKIKYHSNVYVGNPLEPYFFKFDTVGYDTKNGKCYELKGCSVEKNPLNKDEFFFFFDTYTQVSISDGGSSNAK